MGKHIYIKEKATESGVTAEAFTSLKDALKSEGLAHFYRSCTYRLAKGEEFKFGGLTYLQIEAEINSLSVITYKQSQILLQHGKHKN
jgi:hypothetical protein